MLGSNDRIDDRGQVVDVGESLYTQDDVVEGAIFARGRFFGCPDDCITLSSAYAQSNMWGGRRPRGTESAYHIEV